MASVVQWIPESGVGAEHLVVRQEGPRYVAEAAVVETTNRGRRNRHRGER